MTSLQAVFWRVPILIALGCALIGVAVFLSGPGSFAHEFFRR